MKARSPTPLHAEMTKQGRMSKWLAAEIGVSESEVSRWRWGIHVPERPTREAIAERLGVSVAQLWPESQAA